MKKVYFLLNLLVFDIVSFAQDGANAQTILERAAVKVKAASGVNVNFSLTQKDKAGRIVSTSKGNLKAKGSKYYIKQGGSEIFCNGIQVWNYDGEHEVTVAKVDNDDEDAFSPQQILTGFNKIDYKVTLVSSAGTNYQLQLIPVDKRKNFKQVLLYINKSTNLITKAALTDKTNNTAEVTFGSIALNATIADSQFTFDASKHPGVEVVNQ